MSRTAANLAPLGGYELGAPGTWGALPGADPPAGWETDVAAELADTEDGRALLARQLTIMHQALTQEPHLAVAVWVPQPDSGELCGALAVDHLITDEVPVLTREYYRGKVDPDTRRYVEMFSREIEELELPAGPALRANEIVCRDEAQVVEEFVIYTVFPQNCTDAVELTFSTPHLHLAESLADDAAAIADTLVVYPEGSPGVAGTTQ